MPGFRVTFTLQSPGWVRVPCSLNVGGRHKRAHAVAAAAAAVQAGAALDDVVHGLAAMQPVSGRLQPARTRHGRAPDRRFLQRQSSSMRAGIDVLTTASRPGLAWSWGTWVSWATMPVTVRADRHLCARTGSAVLFATGSLSTLAVESFGAGAKLAFRHRFPGACRGLRG